MTTKEALERLRQPFNATPDTDSYFDAKEVAMKSLEKDLSIIKELEKIKDEIKKLTDINPDYPMDRTIHISRNEVLEIIDKHIEEQENRNEN